MRTKCLLVMVLVLCIFIAGPAVYVQAHEQVQISELSGPFGTGSYVVHAAVEDIAKKYHPWLRISHSESPGYVFNLKKLDKEPKLRRSLVIGSGAVLSWMAGQGLKPFDKKYTPAKFLGNYFFVSNWLATLDLNIKSGKDLVGKKIALGRVPQVNWTIEPEWIITHGWGIRDKVSIQYVGTKPAATALLDGLVDAAIVGGYFDPLNMRLSISPQTVELLASGRKINFIPWGEEPVKKTIAKEMPIIPVMLPANTVKGQTQPLAIYTDTAGWYASAEFPEELAYEFTKLVIDHVSKFAEYGDIGKLMSRKGLAFGWRPETIHPGALRAYKEAGIIK